MVCWCNHLFGASYVFLEWFFHQDSQDCSGKQHTILTFAIAFVCRILVRYVFHCIRIAETSNFPISLLLQCPCRTVSCHEGILRYLVETNVLMYARDGLWWWISAEYKWRGCSGWPMICIAQICFEQWIPESSDVGYLDSLRACPWSQQFHGAAYPQIWMGVNRSAAQFTSLTASSGL